jgi:hypothetical protein
LGIKRDFVSKGSVGIPAGRRQHTDGNVATMLDPQKDPLSKGREAVCESGEKRFDLNTSVAAARAGSQHINPQFFLGGSHLSPQQLTTTCGS